MEQRKVYRLFSAFIKIVIKLNTMRIESKRKAWKRAKKYGVDVSLLEMNLSKTPTERVIALQNSILFADSLRGAGVKYYAKLRKNNKTAG